jgi:hypothetical protein
MNNNTSNSKNNISNNAKNNTITNIINNNKQNNITTNSSLNNNIEKCKSLLMNKPLMAMFSIKDIVAGSVGTVIPWFILLIIVGFIIIV